MAMGLDGSVVRLLRLKSQGHGFNPWHCLLIHQDNILGQDANLDCTPLHPEVNMGTWFGDRQFSVCGCN